MKRFLLWTLLLLLSSSGWAGCRPVWMSSFKGSGDSVVTLPLPPRHEDAVGGRTFAHRIAGLSLQDREAAVVQEILSGNVPSFFRTLKPLRLRRQIGSQTVEVVVYVACDYAAVGSDDDYFYVPMTPSTAQYLADRLGCILPTKKLVDVIYARADVKLRPQPIPPSPQMITVPVFLQHTDSIRRQFAERGIQRTPTALVAGHKKDIIISKKIYTPDRDYERVVIYGWHTSVYHPIQPVYNGHHANYADYSHGVRLISNVALLDGDSVRVTDLLRNLKLNVLVSDEGIIPKPYYPPSEIFSAVDGGGSSPPYQVALEPVYPNPVRDRTTVAYHLTKAARVRLSLYNALGQRLGTLLDDRQPSGEHRVVLSLPTLPVGVYYLRLTAGQLAQTQKLVVVR